MTHLIFNIVVIYVMIAVIIYTVLMTPGHKATPDGRRSAITAAAWPLLLLYYLAWGVAFLMVTLVMIPGEIVKRIR